jgi:two-component system chemotaxis response regulator CheY
MYDAKMINLETFKGALKRRKFRDDLVILIVEDQKFSRMMLKNLLAKTYEVITAIDGQKALIEYVTNAPDIVFLDIELPIVDGHKVLSLITKLDPQAYTVMVTGNNYEEDVKRARDGGAKGFVAKPYTKRKIYGCIDEFIKCQ